MVVFKVILEVSGYIFVNFTGDINIIDFQSNLLSALIYF